MTETTHETIDTLQVLHDPRDLADYAERYAGLPFEAVQARYRRRRILQQVAARAPRRLLEVGCGERPLFLDLPDVEVVTVEPADTFAAGAARMAAASPRATVVHDVIEDVDVDAAGGPVDMVVLASLLHEVPRPDVVLSAVRRWCTPTTVVHVNVPQAGSIHRRLGVAMHMLDTQQSLSTQQVAMQQTRVYDRAMLFRDLAAAGLAVHEEGGLLAKPFSHAQMQALVDIRFLDDRLLDGLDALAASWPEAASEIWVDAVVTGA